MSSSLAPKILVYKVDAAVAKGVAVKAGASSNAYCQKCTAKTDKSFGVAQNATTAVDQKAEIAVAGGGGKGLAGGSISMGDMLAPTTDGSLIATTTEDDRIIAQAMQDASTGDLFDIMIVPSGGGA
jgi:hypothetical protein